MSSSFWFINDPRQNKLGNNIKHNYDIIVYALAVLIWIL